MDAWKFENNPIKQTALSLGCIGGGLILAIGFRNFTGPGMTGSLAGFLLGLLLLFIGIAAFLAGGRQTIVVDAKARRISITDTNRFRTRSHLIAFDDIVDIRVGYFGKRSNFVNFYYLVLELGSGEKVNLFSPGYFYDGSSERFVMESRRQRLQEWLRR